MKLALDTVSAHVAAALRAAGGEVVLQREAEEPWEEWVERINASDADAVVSPSRNTGKLAFREGLYWIRLPGSQAGEDQAAKAVKNYTRVREREERALTRLGTPE